MYFSLKHTWVWVSHNCYRYRSSGLESNSGLRKQLRNISCCGRDLDHIRTSKIYGSLPSFAQTAAYLQTRLWKTRTFLGRIPAPSRNIEVVTKIIIFNCWRLCFLWRRSSDLKQSSFEPCVDPAANREVCIALGYSWLSWASVNWWVTFSKVADHWLWTTLEIISAVLSLFETKHLPWDGSRCLLMDSISSANGLSPRAAKFKWSKKARLSGGTGGFNQGWPLLNRCLFVVFCCH